MGNNECCCTGDREDAKKNGALDKYINKWHRDKSKFSQYDKKDFFLCKQDFEVRTFKACKNNEILDEAARKQDMQSEDIMAEDLRSTMVTLTNEMGGVGASKATG